MIDWSSGKSVSHETQLNIIIVDPNRLVSTFYLYLHHLGTLNSRTKKDSRVKLWTRLENIPSLYVICVQALLTQNNKAAYTQQRMKLKRGNQSNEELDEWYRKHTTRCKTALKTVKMNRVMSFCNLNSQTYSIMSVNVYEIYIYRCDWCHRSTYIKRIEKRRY